MIKAIITDLDGTLLPRGGSISSGSLEAFRLAGNKGCIRIIATGRNLYSALKILPAGFPIDYLVSLPVPARSAGVITDYCRLIISVCPRPGK